jgi:hypothetical protein
MYKGIISGAMRHKERIRRLPFIGRVAKAFYRNFLLLRYKEGATYRSLGMKEHDSIYHIGRFGTPNVAKWDYGINLAGYLDTESGVGEAARCFVKVMQSADIPFVLNNVSNLWCSR